MTSSLRILALCGAFFVLSIVLAACGGGGVPGNAVVSIGGDAIKKTEFDHWLTVAAKTQAQQGGSSAAAAVIPDPPEFKRCIAAKRKTAAKPAKGQPKPTDATFKTECQSSYNGLRDQVMQFLISSAWIQGEAADQKVKLTDAEVRRAFDTQRRQSFPEDAAYARFLKTSGYVQEDLLYQIKIQNLSTKLRDKIVKGSDKVSHAAAAAYYSKHKETYAQPERRDLKIVLTKTRAKARQALAALKSGQSFKQVAAKYSVDQASKSAGGVLSGVSKGQQEKALDAATFKAPKHKLEGPIRTQFGYYLFEVTKITPASQSPLSEVEPLIRQQISAQAQQKRLSAFVRTFQKKWRARTNCRKGYVVDTCKNAPKTSTATTATPSAPTQDAPPASGSGSATTTK